MFFSFCFHPAKAEETESIQAERHGIRILRQEESYTSKASFPDCDDIPTYGKNDRNVKFTGSRIHRGLYKTKNSTYLNADINGSANIMRKCIPNAFEGKTLNWDDIRVIRHPMYDAMICNRSKQKNK